MDAVVRKADTLKDLDDSGCVQDEDSLSRKEIESTMEGSHQDSAMEEIHLDAVMENDQRASLLDLSDDVLLCILKYCTPMELKALGFTCPRLGTLVLDRTLWTRVDMRYQRCGVNRLRWMTEHALHPGTTSLLLCGLAREAEGCLGYINKTKPINKNKIQLNIENMEDSIPITNSAGIETRRKRTQTDIDPNDTSRQPSHLHVWATNARQLPRFTTSPYWPPEAEEKNLSSPSEGGCSGPMFTLTPSILSSLRTHCQLHTLQLDFANINVAVTELAQFPKTLKSLSLRGTRCFNMAADLSFFYKINNVLPALEHVNISDCDWVDPAILIPLSKLPVLKKLELRHCKRMYEFIAYGSLAARYGFKQLEYLDVRGSPLGESEISPFAYISTLRELYLSAAQYPQRTGKPSNRHAHYRDEQRGVTTELEEWEKEEPYYYKTPKVDRPPTPEVLPKATTEVPPIKPSNIFTVTLSRNSAPVVEHVAPENLHDFLISQNMVAVNVNDNNEAEVIDAPPMIGDHPEDFDPMMLHDVYEHMEPPVKRRRVEDDDGILDSSDTEDEDGVPKKKPKLCDPNFLLRQMLQTDNSAACFEAAHGVKTGPAASQAIKDAVSQNGEGSVNEGASTSKDNESPNAEKFVKFRRNQPPIMVTKEDLDGSEENKILGRKQEILPKNNENKYFNHNNTSASNDPVKNLIDILEPTETEESVIVIETEMKNAMRRQITNDIRRATAALDIAKLKNRSQNAAEEQNMPSTSIKIKNNDISTPNTSAQNQTNNDSTLPSTSKNINDSELKQINSNNEDLNKPGTSKNTDTEPKVKASVTKVDKECIVMEKEIKNSINREISNDLRTVTEALQSNNRFHDGHPDDNIRPDMQANDRPLMHNRMRMSYLSNLYYTPMTRTVDTTTLVSDSCIKMFGLSDNDDVNYVHIGPNGAFFVGRGHENGIKPCKSNLRKLVCNNYSGITNAALDHLSTAAPNIEFIDFRGTNVTAQGVAEFKSLRPDCEVVFSKFYRNYY